MAGLSISRRKGESIVLFLPDDTQVVITVINARGTVDLAIEAPQEVDILRTELITEGPDND